MQWIIAAAVLIAGLGGMFLLVGTDGNSMRGRGGIAGSFLSGFAEAQDPTAALIALENEKRANMQGEEDDGDPPDPERR
ncbi:MAG: hypothetical protein J7496_03090 [Novosphingobium sp.]|nr:hypothetical protein [Novosphingobium sp.]MBO9601475.1 hypothetical protein [Novosphingobium sp.]